MSLFIETDSSVSIGDVSIKLKKPSSPELVPVKYGEWYTFFKTILKDWYLVKVPSSCMSPFLDPQIAQSDSSKF